MRLLSGILALNLLLTQTVAFAESTRAHLQIASFALGATDLPGALRLADQAEQAIDQNLSTLQMEEAAAAPAGRIERKTQRWIAKLERQAARAKIRFNTRIEESPGAETQGTIDTLALELARNGQSDVAKSLQEKVAATDAKTVVKQGFALQVDRMIPVLAGKIAKSGGVVPFLLHAKAKIQEAKRELARLDSQKRDGNRSIASASEFSDVLDVLVGVGFAVFGLCLIFGIFLLSWGAIVMLSGAAVAIIATALGGELGNL